MLGTLALLATSPADAQRKRKKKKQPAPPPVEAPAEDPAAPGTPTTPQTPEEKKALRVSINAVKKTAGAVDKVR